jgi:hypothetical protein
VPGEPLAPTRGILQGRGSPDYLLAAGAQRASTRRDPLICPASPPPCPHPRANRGRSAVSPATRPVGGPGTARPRPSHHPHPRAVRDTRRPPHRTSGIPMVLGRVPAQPPTPRSPAPINVNWVLRDSDPGMASASMGSVFLVF